MKSGFLCGAALLAAIASAACENATPTSPTTAQSPFVTQLVGMWTGSTQLTSVSGGECVGADLRAAVAAGTSPSQNTLTITQTLSDVTAVVRSTTSGTTCSYRGNAALATFALSDESCDREIVFQCSTGQTRILAPIGSTITATVSGNTATGTVATSYNVFSESTEEAQRRPVAGLTTQSQFTAVRR
jgi:hypothetical protein